jgi:carboxymethylenebutenolidase
MTADVNNLSRRAFVAATGYALAVSPVTAWAIETPATGLDVADVTIPVGKDRMPGYAAWPKKAGAHPVVIVVQEIFGLHAYIKDVCRRLAAEGYYAVAPSLYFRKGDATKIESINKLLTGIVSKVAQPQVMGDLDATMAWLGEQKAADAQRVAITGFCWGGNVVWTYSAHNPRIKAGVAWYGKLTGDPAPSTKYPIELAPGLTVPVLGLYGEKDKGIPLEGIEAMRKALAKGASGSKIIVYPGAEHGFHADYRPSYDEKAAKAGWAEMLAWFKQHGVAV